jgi:putative ABC transport system permease protein
LAWYLIDQWLSTFAYQIEVSPITFLIAGAMTFVVALATIGIQSLKASITNPVESLKYE